MRRCRVAASVGPPFACPEGCLFFEERPLSTVGWAREAPQPMSNTSLGLADLPPKPARPSGSSGRGGKTKKKGRKGR
jgi:hypothetical protein